MPIFGSTSEQIMEQEVNQYLATLLTKIEAYELSAEEKKKSERAKADFLLDKIIRKKFRRRVWGDTREYLQRQIKKSLNENRPLHFTIPFGGYKHYWNPAHPEPDWAELFHFRFMTDYVLPMLSVHEPGVILEYISEDMIIPLMNNYPEEALESYSAGFRPLIEWYSQFTPSNLELRFFRVGERYDKNEIIKKVEALLPERREAFAKLTAEEQEQEIHRSQRSVFWQGKQDLSGLSDAEKSEKIIMSRLTELAYYDTEAEPEYLGDYFTSDNHIDTWFSGGLSPDNVGHSLSLATCYGSIVDYWIGRGVLQSHHGKLHPTIISRQQYADSKSNLQIIEISPELVPLKNFKAIEILPL